MEWIANPATANWIALGALVMAVITFIWSRRDVASARRSAAEADMNADRAVAAAEDSASSVRKVAEAQTSIAASMPDKGVVWQVRLSPIRAADPVARLNAADSRMQKVQLPTWQIKNVGTACAEIVEMNIEGPDGEDVMVRSSPELPRSWMPGFAQNIEALQSFFLESRSCSDLGK